MTCQGFPLLSAFYSKNCRGSGVAHCSQQNLLIDVVLYCDTVLLWLWLSLNPTTLKHGIVLTYLALLVGETLIYSQSHFEICTNWRLFSAAQGMVAACSRFRECSSWVLIFCWTIFKTTLSTHTPDHHWTQVGWSAMLEKYFTDNTRAEQTVTQIELAWVREANRNIKIYSEWLTLINNVCVENQMKREGSQIVCVTEVIICQQSLLIKCHHICWSYLFREVLRSIRGY